MHPVLARADEVAVMAASNVITLNGKPSGAAVRSINLDARVLRPDRTWSEGGNTVYFGKYNNTATAYRVLSSPGTQTNTADYLLFDCDTAPIDKKFDDDGIKNSGQTYQNEWKGSDLDIWLNGNEFYGNSSVFSALEKAAIADTELSAQNKYFVPSSSGWAYKDADATNHVFCLSAKEVYGLYAGNPASRKGARWWLRSASGNAPEGILSNVDFATGLVGYVMDANQSSDYINKVAVNDATFQIKVSPAFNVSPAAILFASESGRDKSADLAAVSDSAVKAWKLTLLDSGKTVRVTDGQSLSRQDSTITVPYTYTDSNTANPVSQISVMITDQPYKDSGAKVLYYGALQNVTNISDTSGTGTFTLPSELVEKNCGTDYYVYIIAEDANGATETDYAGEPVQISALPATSNPVITTQPVGVSVKAGGTAAFTVAASGDYLTYQWQISKDNGNTWEDISGANTASYTISAVSKDFDGFLYQCVVSNSQGNRVEISDSVTLTVQDAGGSNPGSSGGSSGSGSSGSSGSSNTPSKPDTDYRVISGAESSWTSGSSEGLTIRGSGEYSKFIGVKVDGKLLDRSHYTVKEGSTIITLKTAYLNTLAAGKHTVEILWTDGSASITLHIRSSQLLPFVVAIKTAAITKALRIIMQHQVFRNFLVMA